MTDKNLPEGYLIKLTTWENDADNYNTVEFAGLTADEVNFYIAVAELFESNGRRGVYKEFGNGEVEVVSEAVEEAIDEIVDKWKDNEWKIPGKYPNQWDKSHPDSVEWIKNNEAYFEKHGYRDMFYSDALYDLIGIWNDGEYYRVFDGFEVFEVPATIINVTQNFK